VVPKNTHLVSNRCFRPILHGEREISKIRPASLCPAPNDSITYASSGKPVIKAERNASYSVRLDTGKILTGGVAELQATLTVQDPSLAISAIEAPPNGSTLFPDSVWKELGHLPKSGLSCARELKDLSVSCSHLWNLAKAGKIEHVGRGLYRAKEAPISTNETLFEVAKRIPLGVLCLSTALRFHELTTENPSKTP
jgi:hypothetical protein